MSSEVEQLRRELAELRGRYQAMMEFNPDALVVFDLDTGLFTEVNSAACDFFGLPREELVKTGPAERSPSHQPDGRPSPEAAMDYIQQALAGDQPVFEWMHISAGGEPRPCRIQLARVPVEGRSLVRGSLSDLTRQKGVEEARDRFRELLDATTDFVGIADPQGRTLYVNPACRKALGYGDDEDLKGRPIASYHTEESAKMIVEQAIAEAVRNGVWQGETVFLARDGRRIPTSQVLIAHRSPHGELEHLSTIARDLTERRMLEQQALHAQKLDSLGLMAGSVAHDFNNILVGILGNLSLLREDTTLEPDAAESLAAALTAAHRAADLAREMLAYSGKAQIDLQAVRISELVHDITGLLAASISKKATLRFEFGTGVPPVWGDPTQLRQILMNLVLNASEALEDESGEILVRTGLVRPDPAALLHSYLEPESLAGECVYCEVTDTGPGMAAELVERIFDPFFSTKFTGRGLGLAAVLGIMKAHHGAISLETAPGKGTTFCLVLPVSNQAAAVRTREDSGPYEQARAGSILVVDDEPAVRRLAARALQRRGYEVTEARDGGEALEKLAATAGGFLAIVLDLTMPRLGGHEVLTRLGVEYPDLPVVLTSGYAGVEIPEAQVFLEKPFTPDGLVRAIDQAIADKTSPLIPQC